jgi:hypothetical protein
MAVNYSPKIITDGLVLYLDAANTRSYPGSGTVWSDLSRGGNNGTLRNGPTFNSGNGGSIVFDGVNDYASFPNNTNLDNQKITMENWVYPTITLSQQGFIFEKGFEIAEITCPTKYFSEASSINLSRSIKYGLGVLGVSIQYFFKRILS